MAIGIKQRFRLAAAQAVAASTALVDITGWTIPVVAGSVVHFRYFLLFSVGGAGGCKFNLSTPAVPTNVASASKIYDTATTAVIDAVQSSASSIANALASAGSHIFELEGEVVNGVTAGDFKLQFAQNSSNATAITLLVGSYLDVTIF